MNARGCGAAAWPSAARAQQAAMPVIGFLDPTSSDYSNADRLRAAAAWPSAARAQQAAMPVIGFLNPTSPDVNADGLRAFRQGLKDTGYVEGENVAIEYRWAENQLDRLPVLADELVRRQVAVIATTGATAAASVAKAATTTIPIVFLTGADPVRDGLVASLARPGGNLTGINLLTIELTAKRLELLRELVPVATRVAVLVNPAGPAPETMLKDVEVAARAIGLQIQVLNAGTSREINAASNFCARAARCSFRWQRPLFRQPACPIGPSGIAPRSPCRIYGA
jgi:ABC-type uncharacterized transport system substrate-binding protein